MNDVADLVTYDAPGGYLWQAVTWFGVEAPPDARGRRMPRPAGSKSMGRTKSGETFIRDSSGGPGRKWRKAVQDRAREFWTGAPLEGVPLRLDFEFIIERPRAHFRKGGELSAAGLRESFPLGKPDTLKLARAVEDALTGIIYRDDAMVVDHASLRKRYGSPGGVQIVVYRLAPDTLGRES